MLALALPVLLMSRDELRRRRVPRRCSCRRCTASACCCRRTASSTLFLGLELMSLPVYVLVLLAYRRPQSAEAALKYLVLGGTATATLPDGRLAAVRQRAARWRSTPSRARSRAGDGLARAAVVLVVARLLPQGGDRAVPRLGARRLRRRERAGDGVHGDDRQGRRAAGGGAAVRHARSSRRRCSSSFALLPLVSIVWGNLAAMRQPSFRRMIAYSLDRPRRLPLLRAARRRRRAPPGGGLLPARLRPHEPARLRRAARRRRRRRARPPRQPEGAVPSRARSPR